MDKIFLTFKERSFSDKIALIGLPLNIIGLLIAFLAYVFPLSPALVPTVFCPPLLSSDTLRKWQQAGEVTQPFIETYINEFNQIRGVDGGFSNGDILPKGAFIITAFGDRGETLIYRAFPVKPIVHYNSYGVFQTTDVLESTFDGACLKLEHPTFPFYITIPAFFAILFSTILARSKLLSKKKQS